MENDQDQPSLKTEGQALKVDHQPSDPRWPWRHYSK